ncbi:hypothetical protein [Legionella sp.]|uniref:hypothetical protein n=1 Tax=Legionella sp. TaxID=459 RepID=UPI000CAAE542|nr:hypothetical protein [Legionella sp.]PJE11920.1 MAG: hypothetical protein CK430_08100 [Legionella sp.]
MDPLGELEDSLAYMFELQTKHTGGYIEPSVNKLRMALNDYKDNSSSTSLKNLISAIKKAFPVIEKYYIDSFKVRQKIEALAGTQGESINWYTSKEANRYPFFQPSSSARDSKTDFIPWLSARTGKDFGSLSGEAQVQMLIEEKSDKEFTVKLKLHLHANPDFLANLAMESPNAFIKLMSSSLGFQLEKYQIAKAIYHHGKTIMDESLKMDKSSEPIEKVMQLVDYLNEQLSSLHSIEKLLEDPKAKAVLDKSELFQLYQSEEYKERQDYDASAAPAT